MKLDYNYKMVQKQKLALTNSMKQSIEILQMPVYDLHKYIQEELEKNPVLEVEEYKENFQINSDDEISPLNFISQKKSLKDYLYEQLMGIKINDKNKLIIKYMIECIDDKGYLVESIEDICKKLKTEEKDVQDSLNILQGFEPLGIGARDLKECLLIQAKEKLCLDSNLEKIILSYLEQVAENNYKFISEKLNIEKKEAQAYINIIKKLEPKPSRGFFTGDETKFIVPDAYIVKIDNQYKVIMNDIIPILNINSIYKEIEGNGDEERYIKDNVLNASNLIKAIEARKNTLCRLLEYAVRNQQTYFEKGAGYLKPMTLNEAASELNVHSSTLSRTVKDKYIFTDFGTIKIKSLFCNGVSYKSDANGELTVDNIKIKIANIIKNEDKKKPLSDKVICDMLNEENLEISRRTVAKYREEMEIKSSTKRKVL